VRRLGFGRHPEGLVQAEPRGATRSTCRTTAFPSGLRILFQSERSQPIVAITSVIDSGGSNDQPGYEGIAHVIEHLNFRAKHGDLPKNWDTILELGGDLNASTWPNSRLHDARARRRASRSCTSRPHV
jgi:predicted Zn-dependent peptidase